jgi:hypothetical protein
MSGESVCHDKNGRRETITSTLVRNDTAVEKLDVSIGGDKKILRPTSVRHTGKVARV